MVLRLEVASEAAVTRRISQPRLFPIERPLGPHLPGALVDWTEWQHDIPTPLPAASADADPTHAKRDDDITAAAEAWYAGAEAELTTLYGVFGTIDEARYLGLGMPHSEVLNTASRRFTHVPDCLGLIGQRLDWTLRGVHLMKSLGILIVDAAKLRHVSPTPHAVSTADKHIDTLSRIGHRAAAFARETWAI